MKALAILIDPSGEEWFIAYGPKTKLRDKASRFANGQVAINAARSIIFGDSNAFWNSEREHARRTAAEHKGWTYRIEEVEDWDKAREGFWIARYPAGASEAKEYVTCRSANPFSPHEEEAALWDTWAEAREVANGINRPEGYNIAISRY